MPHRRLPEPFVFFIDECLGRHIVRDAVQGALLQGETVKNMPPGTADEDWLPLAGEKWICLTKDGKLRTRPNEIEAIRLHGAGIFLLGEASGAEQAARVVRAMPLRRRIARTHELAFIARLDSDGQISVQFEAGSKLAKAKRVRAKANER